MNGQTYQNQTIKAGDQFFNVRGLGAAQAPAACYPAGAPVMVDNDPANPPESAVER